MTITVASLTGASVTMPPESVFAYAYIEQVKIELRKLLQEAIKPAIEEAVNKAAIEMKPGVSAYLDQRGMYEISLQIVLHDKRTDKK